jgi:hypothetical protein
MAEKYSFTVLTKETPIVEISGEGSCTYVWFNRSAKYAKTVTKSTWPVLNIDLAENDEVIGIEAVGIKEFTLRRMLQQAGVKVPEKMINDARYIHADVPA